MLSLCIKLKNCSLDGKQRSMTYITKLVTGHKFTAVLTMSTGPLA